MPTLREQLEKLTSLKHRLAVWEAIYQLMDAQFITKDGRKAQSIRVMDCPPESEMVPETVIEDVLQTIGEGPVAELRSQIQTIEEQDVVVIEKEVKHGQA